MAKSIVYSDSIQQGEDTVYLIVPEGSSTGVFDIEDPNLDIDESRNSVLDIRNETFEIMKQLDWEREKDAFISENGEELYQDFFDKLSEGLNTVEGTWNISLTSSPQVELLRKLINSNIKDAEIGEI